LPLDVIASEARQSAFVIRDKLRKLKDGGVCEKVPRRHCEEPSDEAICLFWLQAKARLLRYARNDIFSTGP
jgi:hypothetical protein